MSHRSTDYFDSTDLDELISCRQWLDALASLTEKQECYASASFLNDAVAELLEREREIRSYLDDVAAG